jgi:anthranilate/para-aminobenzoate synthase component I
VFVALPTDLPTDPFELARRIWDADSPALLWSADPARPSFLACEADACRHGLDPEPSLLLGDETSGLGEWASVPRWIGVLPYEHERSRLERPAWAAVERREAPHIAEAVWWRYPAVCVITDRVTLVGEARAVARLATLLARAPRVRPDCVLHPLPVESADVHVERVRAALELIRRGDLYQVNLSRLLSFHARGDALGWLEQMGAHSRPAFGAALQLPSGEALVSTSPELFLRTYPDGLVETVPIKGTRPRGGTKEADAALAADLDSDPKERAELSMVIDVERNDLGKIAEVGSVQVEPAQVSAHGQVLHRAARVFARLRPEVSRTDLLSATLPSGSVTGAPKIRAMEVISTLESARRGIYTGALGYLAYDGSLQLAMAIRCLAEKSGLAHYLVGGGIVKDSLPERELLETEWKAVQVQRLLAGVPAPPDGSR